MPSVVSPRLLVTFACVCALFSAHPVAAQPTTSGPLAGLVGRVKPGDRVEVIGPDGRTMEGAVIDLSGAMLKLNIGRGLVLEPAAVRKVVLHDSLKNGAMYGFLAGVLAGGIVGLGIGGHCQNEGGSGCAIGAVFLGLGAGAGAGIGAAIDGLFNATVYDASHPSTPTPVKPWLASRGRGVTIAFRF